MRLSTTHNHVRRLESLIKDCHTKARVYQMTSDQFLADKKARVWNDSAMGKLPHWAKSYLHGYANAKFDTLYRHELEWKVLYRGQYIDGTDVPKGQWNEVQPGAFFWKNGGGQF